jgi:hypothetical protein
MLHRRVCPDAGVIVAPLPVCVEVMDELLAIPHNLAIDGVVHFSAPEVLLDRVVRYFARRIPKLDDSAIHAKSKTGKVINGLQTPRSCLSLLISRQSNDLLFKVGKAGSNSPDCPPSHHLTNSTTKAGNASQPDTSTVC